ncbi:MAG TPA: hypothetical protein VHS99_00395 [Chloroflexota bacterium]|nr:hypothetical protein [Chloroflexota bacterium]
MARAPEGILCAWGRAGPGARLIVIPRDVDEALALLNGLATPAPHHCAGRAAQWRIAQGESTEQGERRETARLEAQRRAALM